MIEYINSIAHHIPSRIVTYIQHVKNPCKNAIFVQSLPRGINKSKAILLNTEQMTSPAKRKKYSKSVHVNIDYAHANLFASQGNKFFVPYQVNPKELCFKNVKKTYDVAIICPRTDRRLRIVNRIRSMGYKVNIVVGYGIKRDQTLARAKILLNVHHNSKFKVHEAIRCDRWILNKTIVVSEESNPIHDPIEKFMISVPYDQIVKTVDRILKNYDEEHKKLFVDFNLKQIRDYKRSKLDEFIRYIHSPKNTTRLSILIPTLQSRKPTLDRLVTEVNRQIEKSNLNIELLIESDNGQITTGKKRNILIRRAKGEYCVFLDDDDLIAPDYIESFEPMLKSDKYDCADLWGAHYKRGIFNKYVHYSNKFKKWSENPKKFIRTPQHLNVVRTVFYRNCPFPDSSHGEDRQNSMCMVRKGLLKTEYKTKRFYPLYHYISGVKKIRNSIAKYSFNDKGLVVFEK